LRKIRKENQFYLASILKNTSPKMQGS